MNSLIDYSLTLLESEGNKLLSEYLNIQPRAIDFSNMTVSTITSGSKFPQLVQNAASIANTCFFIPIYVIICSIVVFYYLKSKNTMMRNQKILFFLLFSFVMTQLFALLLRLIYNCTGLHINLVTPNIEKDTVIEDLKLMWATSFMENVISFLQMIPFSIAIMSFIQVIFLRTVEKAGAMSKKAYTIIFWFVMVVTVIAVTVQIILAILNGLVNLLVKMQEITFDVTPIYIALFIVYIAINITEIVIFLASGIRLIYVVRKNSLGATQVQHTNTLKSFMNRPYTKIVGLIIGILIFQLCAILSIIVSVFTSLLNDDLHIIDYFLHGLGVTTFSAFVLFCYAPFWSQENQKIVNGTNLSLANVQNVELKGEPTSPSPLLGRRKSQIGKESPIAQQTGSDVVVTSPSEVSQSDETNQMA